MIADEDVLALIRGRKLQQRGIGWVDAQVLASALVANASVWTIDRDLAAIAARLGVAFDASP